MPEEILRIEVRPERDRVVLALYGELDHFSARSVRRAVRDLVSTSPGEVVLDLRGLEFMDAGGIHLLKDLRDGRYGPGRYRMVGGVEPVHRPLQMIGEERILPRAEADPVGPSDGDADAGR